MNPETERKNRIISGISTTLICIGLFLLFWFYNFHYELPVLPESSEVAVSLGEPDAGGPNDAPMPAESSPSVPTMPMPDVHEQTTDPDAVATKKTTETPKKPQDKPVETPKEKDNLLNDLLKGKQNQNPSNAGDGSKTGAQGDPNGQIGGATKGGQTGTGTGGNGTAKHSFTGRSFKPGSTSKKCNEEGIVILDVLLKPNGTIQYEGINPASSGSNCLETMAIDYLRSSSFNASSNPVSVEGTITFTFKLK